MISAAHINSIAHTRCSGYCQDVSYQSNALPSYTDARPQGFDGVSSHLSRNIESGTQITEHLTDRHCDGVEPVRLQALFDNIGTANLRCSHDLLGAQGVQGMRSCALGQSRTYMNTIYRIEWNSPALIVAN